MFKSGDDETSLTQSAFDDEPEFHLPESNLNWSDASTKLTKEVKKNKNTFFRISVQSWNSDIFIFIESTVRSEAVSPPCISDLVCLVWG